ncbi:MAG: hypothetical protein C5B50_02315 [Verrucomicrobia bacterium]|nr:MAG: hypothetical protein C5B50_02315 [Verrucomicrobiota bacterium]
MAAVFLSLLTLFSGYTFLVFYIKQNRLIATNDQLGFIQRDRFMVNALATEAAEFANNNHPDIIPILEARGYHFNKPAAAAPTNKATK